MTTRDLIQTINILRGKAIEEGKLYLIPLFAGVEDLVKRAHRYRRGRAEALALANQYRAERDAAREMLARVLTDKVPR